MPLLRRRHLLASAAATALLAHFAKVQSVSPNQAPPNIFFLLADDLGYADVGCYGRPDRSTANIDRIAADGIRFLQAYANSAVCSATRTALITGRHQSVYASASRNPSPAGHKMSACRRPSQRCPPCSKKPVTAPHFSADGTSANRTARR